MIGLQHDVAEVPMNARVFIPVDKAAFYRFIAKEPEGRYEFERGRIVQQLTGGTQKHFRIAQRFLLALIAQVDPTVSGKPPAE